MHPKQWENTEIRHVVYTEPDGNICPGFRYRPKFCLCQVGKCSLLGDRIAPRHLPLFSVVRDAHSLALRNPTAASSVGVGSRKCRML